MLALSASPGSHCDKRNEGSGKANVTDRDRASARSPSETVGYRLGRAGELHCLLEPWTAASLQAARRMLAYPYRGNPAIFLTVTREKALSNKAACPL
jgi:hypothetical protein